jgi:hypothetical protein
LSRESICWVALDVAIDARNEISIDRRSAETREIQRGISSTAAEVVYDCRAGRLALQRRESKNGQRDVIAEAFEKRKKRTPLGMSAVLSGTGAVLVGTKVVPASG